VRLTTSPPSGAECREIWEPKPPGILWATPGYLWDHFTFTFTDLFGCKGRFPEKGHEYLFEVNKK
jgi:hypothetical protein